MTEDRNLSAFDHLSTEDKSTKPYHSTEWDGALSTQPLGARNEREEIIGTARPISTNGRTEQFEKENGSVKAKLHSVTEKAHEKLHDAKERVKPIVRQKVDAVRTPVQHKIAEIRPVVDHRVSTAKQSGRDAVARGRGFLRDNPAILPALTTGIGLVVGMMARRALRRRKPLGVVIVEPRKGEAAPVW